MYLFFYIGYLESILSFWCPHGKNQPSHHPSPALCWFSSDLFHRWVTGLEADSHTALRAVIPVPMAAPDGKNKQTQSFGDKSYPKGTVTI